MSNTSWFENVIGGIAPPRIVLISSSNLCTNNRFDTDTSGWSSNANLDIVSDSDSYGSNMGKLWWTTANSEYAEYETADTSVNGKTFLIALRIKNNNNEKYKIKIQFLSTQTGLISEKIFYIDNFIKRISFTSIVKSFTESAGNRIQIKIFGSLENKANVDVRFDDIYIQEIMYDYIFPQPQKSSILWKNINSGSSVLIDGRNKIYNKRWIPNYKGIYDFYTKQFEEYLQRIAETDYLIFVFPHSDFSWGFFGIWKTDYDRQPPFDRFIGHKGMLDIKGDEYFVSTIHPITAGDEIATLYNLAIKAIDTEGANEFAVETDIIVTADYNGNGNGTTIFNRIYENNTVINLIASLTITIENAPDGESNIREFVKWKYSDGTVISANNNITVNVLKSDDIIAVYQEKIEASSGYGFNYGGSYGNNL